MKPRLIILLCLLNLTVLGVGCFWGSVYLEGRLSQQGRLVVSQLNVLKTQAVAAIAAAPPLPSVIYRTNPFTWSQLESTDYRQYIANLRAVGCPEPTLRDIIITDVMRLYAARRGQFFQNGRPFKYWETDDKRKLKQTQIEERDAQLALIDKELPAILRELLGINYERELDKYFVDAGEDDRRLAFLSGEKRARVLALRDQREGLREKVLWQVADGKPAPDQIAQLRQIDQENEAALSALLSPDEKYEFDLTSSPTADRMRRELIGFNPSEAEFRQIFTRERALDAAYADLDTNDEAVAAAKAAEEKQMRADIEAALGPDRAAQFEQAGNPEYQNLTILAQRFDLPDGVAQAMLDMRQSVEDARRQLLANPALSDPQREAALQAVQAETERAARETLGDKAYAEYARGAPWVRGP
jgi:hypothetical protein